MASDYEWPAELQAGAMWGGEIRRATYTLNDAARAWQAFRDFLNGSVEQWNELLADACIDARGDGYWDGYEDGQSVGEDRR